MATNPQLKQEKGETIQISTLFKFIKTFDGSRDKLNSFINNCDNAFELATAEQKKILFKYILSQLEGKAETAVSIKEYESWDQLREFLKTQFGERKHYSHLLTDLQECRQQTSEQVHQFSLRVETCLSKLLTEVTLSNKKKSELAGRTAAMEELALHTFLLGLKSNISNLVRGKNPSNLNEAINLAISEEKILNSLYKRNSQVSNYVQKPHYTFRPAINNVNTKPQSHRPMAQNYQGLFCRYCKAQGHTLEVCKKREYNNNRFRVPQTAQPASSQNYPKPGPAHVNYMIKDHTEYNPENHPNVNDEDEIKHYSHDYSNNNDLNE